MVVTPSPHPSPLRGEGAGRTRLSAVLFINDRYLLRTLDGLEAAHVALQHIRHGKRATLLLLCLTHGAQRPADRDARPIESMEVAHLAILAAVARVHSAGLEIAAHRAGGYLAIHVLAGEPDLDVVGLLRGKAHVAGAQRHDA